MDTKTIQLVEREKWFHAVDLGPIVTKSWVYGENLPPNYHLFSVFRFLEQINLQDKRCLDLGTYDGMVAFVMARLGAAEVTATCQHDLSRFRLLRTILHCENVKYVPNFDIEVSEILKVEDTYDLIVISGMLHHLMSPMRAILFARNNLSRNGLLIIEAAVINGTTASLSLNTELQDPVYGAPTIWLPTKNVLLGMLRLVGFDPLATIELQGTEVARETNYKRFTVLAKARNRDAVRHRTKKLVELHEKIDRIAELDFESLEGGKRRQSRIAFSGVEGHEDLDIWTYSPNVPLQPKWRGKNVESTRSDSGLQCFRLGRCSDLIRFRTGYKEYAWSAEDFPDLQMKYPGECFPEGQAWGLKQLGNLFCIDYIKRTGAQRVLEVGAGFNLFFDRRIGEEYEYWMIDEPGFYDSEIFETAMSRRRNTRFIEGRLGEFNSKLPDSYFDVVLSVSVLEHIPTSDVKAVCEDMHRLLKPGRFSVHSLDVTPNTAITTGLKYRDELRKAGFLIGTHPSIDWEVSSNAKEQILLEPLSLVVTFYGGYKPDPWSQAYEPRNYYAGTVLIGAQRLG